MDKQFTASFQQNVEQPDQLVNVIDRFIGEFAFLSNFYPSTIRYRGELFRTVEHAYQAAKTQVESERKVIQSAKTPGEAKKLGRSVTLRGDWDTIKVDLMRQFVKLKFENPLLREMLLATGDADLIEGNYWNDKFWGVCRGHGENWLGRILMEVRAEIAAENAAEEIVLKSCSMKYIDIC